MSRKDWREFDQIVSLYTKEYGKIELLARGVKKIVSKNSAHLEPFSNIFVESVRGKEIDHLTRVVPILFFPNIRQDLAKSLAAGYAVSFLEKSMETREPDERIFDCFLSWLKFVEKQIDFNFILLDGLMIMILSFFGFQPIIEKCVVCEKAIKNMIKENLADSTFNKIGFYFSGGGVICQNCRIKKEEIREKIFDCGLPEISGLQVLLKGDWRVINEFEMEEKEKKALHRLVYEFVLFHSEKKITDWAFLAKMVK